MSFSTVKLSEVAPAKSIKINNINPNKTVWQLTLDHIESNTGKLIKKEIIPYSEIGSSTHWFNEKNVLYSKLRPYLNKVYLPKEQGVGTTELVPMLPDPKRLNRNYLAYYLKSPKFVAWVSNQTAGAKMPRVSMRSFWEHEIPLPPLEEQKRITAILDKADAIRRKRQQAIQLADEYLRSVFLDMFGDPVTNPKGWLVKNFGDLVINKDGDRVPLKAEDRKSITGTYPYYGASGVIDYINDFLFEGRKLLIGEDGANLVARSTPVAFIADGRYWVNNHAHVLENKDGIDLDYLLFSINQRTLIPYITGSAQPKLNQKSLNNIPTQVPPIELQQKFAKQVQKVEALKTKLNASLDQTDQQFKALSQRAFAGEL